VTVVLKIDARLQPLVRSDALATIATQGVVGAKVVEITPGEPDASPLAEGGTIRAEDPIEMADLLRDAQGAMGQVQTVAKAAEEGLGEVNAIAASIRRGEGTLGKLVRDDEAYNRLLALSERGERAIVALDDNLSALKGMRPIKGYFEERGFEDIDKVLYRPDATREGRSYATADLFEPGTAILTAEGREKLDEFARWFKSDHRPNSAEVVVAAYADPHDDETKARILTNQQARAVRSYLETQHELFKLPWFRTRKSAAVGFGTERPRTSASPEPGAPPRRIESCRAG
jgi:phospholipid/cholesterol/gamma-HCH transport system substrate-binding protein